MTAWFTWTLWGMGLFIGMTLLGLVIVMAGI